MTLSVPHDVVDRLLLGPPDNRRQLQDSPILGDVWIAFANDPAGAQDLLITPHKDDTASQLAVGIEEQLDRDDRPEDDPEIAYLQGVVVAKLRFEEILRVVVPMTGWWKSERTTTEFADFLKPEEGRAHLLRTIADALGIVRAQRSRSPTTRAPICPGCSAT